MLKIDEFRMEMEESKKIYSEELAKFSKKYDFLSDFVIVEEPDIEENFKPFSNNEKIFFIKKKTFVYYIKLYITFLSKF